MGTRQFPFYSRIEKLRGIEMMNSGDKAAPQLLNTLPFRGTTWFLNEVKSAKLKCTQSRVGALSCVSGKHDNPDFFRVWPSVPLLDSLECRQPVHLRHFKVKRHHVYVAGLEKVQSLPPVPDRTNDFDTILSGKSFPNGVTKNKGIIHDQNLGCAHTHFVFNRSLKSSA